jgi:Raf kinase inhibitor-like YbhB/YbcL family protein
MPLTLTSGAFAHGEALPREYSCDGGEQSPALVWDGVPAAAKSLALIVDDPDAPSRTFVHWVVYNIPSDARTLPRGARAATLPPGAREGKNDARGLGYCSPCPPRGARHRYVFKLYALDAMFDGLGTPTKAQLEARMQGHVLDHTELMAFYQREG